MRHLIVVAFTLLAATAAAPASAQYYGGDGYRGNDYRGGFVYGASLMMSRYRECPIGDGHRTFGSSTFTECVHRRTCSCGAKSWPGLG